MRNQKLVALYARVSTTQQDIQSQIEELREHARRRAWAIAGEYIDHGVSGARDSRPALNNLMADAKRRKFDAVAVVKLDRFGRSLRHLINALAEFEGLGVGFISLRDSIDLSTPAGRLMFNVIGAMAEFERDLIRERVINGQRRAKARGSKFGRPRVIVNTDTIHKLRAKGTAWKAIAKTLGVGVGTVYRRAQA